MARSLNRQLCTVCPLCAQRCAGYGGYHCEEELMSVALQEMIQTSEYEITAKWGKETMWWKRLEGAI